jgi:hypothetical protein
MLHPSNVRLFATLATCGALGAAVLLYSTRWGVGLSPDSVVYISAARSLLAGAGFSVPSELEGFSPITHYPPLYSGLLAVIGLFGSDPLEGAKWLNAAIFALNIFLTGGLLFAVFGVFQLSIVVALVALTAFPLVQVHTMAWSESPFILCQLLSLHLLLLYLKVASKGNLVLASVGAGLSSLFRYAGLSIVSSGVLAILFLSCTDRRHKGTDALLFAGIGLLPTIIWTARNWQLAGEVVNRTVTFHPAALEQMLMLPAVIGGWFSLSWSLSWDFRALIWVGMAVGGFVFSYSALGKAKSIDVRQADKTGILMIVVIVNYLTMLVLSLIFLDAQIPVDTRTLSPIYVPLVVFGIAVTIRLLAVPIAGSSGRLLITICLSLLLAAQFPVSLNWLQFSFQSGIGYAGRQWKESQTLNKLKHSASSTVIFSNAPDVLYALLNRPAIMIARKTHTDTNLPNQQYPSQMLELGRRLKDDGALLVYFHGIHWRWYLPTAKELEQSLNLQAFARESDGVIYQSRLYEHPDK